MDRKEKENSGTQDSSKNKPGPDGIIDIKTIAKEIARINGIEEEEVVKITKVIVQNIKSQLDEYGEADYLGMGKLVASDSPDADYELIPYPEEIRKKKWQLFL